MGGYFNAMQLFGDDMIKDKLNLIDLGFTNFEIIGIIKQDVFFIGIFQNFPDKAEEDKDAKILFLDAIASRFIHRYPMSEIQKTFVSHAKFRDFTDTIMEISKGEIKKQNCRNCLTKCIVENKGCLPHNFYFENVNIQDGDGMVYLKGPINDTSL